MPSRSRPDSPIFVNAAKKGRNFRMRARSSSSCLTLFGQRFELSCAQLPCEQGPRLGADRGPATLVGRAAFLSEKLEALMSTSLTTLRTPPHVTFAAPA